MHAEDILSESHKKLVQLENLFSLYKENSQLSMLNKNGYLENPHPDMLALLNLSKNLNVSQNNKVIGLRPENGKISVLTDTFYKWQIFDGVISTLPAPQILLLIQQFRIYGRVQISLLNFLSYS